jgi:glycosyltransferase involved in cell wall biosynthesis
MRIGIIIDLIDENSTGIAVYATELLKHILDIDRENKYLLIHHKKIKNSIFNYQNVEDVIIPTYFFDRKRTVIKFVQIPYYARHLSLDVIFDISQVGSFLFPCSCHTIGMVYDTTFMYYPQYYSFLAKILNKVILPMIIKNTKDIITVSNNSKKDIIKFYHVLSKKISVIYGAIDNNQFHNKSITDEEKNIFKKKYNLPNNYLLYLGALVPHKNPQSVIQAYLIAKKKISGLKLVIVGPRLWQQKKIFSEFTSNDLKNIIFTGFVPDQDIPLFYQLADIFIFPSFYEGFGFPVLEAMACGCPVITSGAGSIKEIAGEAAYYINPKQPETIANGIIELIHKPNLANQIKNLGLERVKYFSWQNSAQLFLNIINNLK